MRVIAKSKLEKRMMLGLAGRFIGDDSGIYRQSAAVTRSLHLLGTHY
jgi:hypothetical protein